MTAQPGYIGQRVRMTWTGGTKDGHLSGELYQDKLPTGAVFAPVTFDDGTTANADCRTLSSIVGE